MTFIKSSANKQYKILKSLSSKKNRYKLGLYRIEGMRIVSQACYEKKEIHSVFIKASIHEDDKVKALVKELENHLVGVYLLDDALFEGVSDTVNSQGIVAMMPMEDILLETCLKNTKVSLLILDRIQDPGNLGTMIRTADAAGFDAVLLGKGTVDPYNEKVLRSTMGSIFQIPVIQVGEIVPVIDNLIAQNVNIYATALDGAVDYDRISYPEKVGIVIGNEGNGIEENILDMAHQNIKIPMAGKAESLNASIAASVVMYEVFRQKRRNA